MERGIREKLPSKRRGRTYEFKIEGTGGARKAFLTLNVYPDARLGECFLVTAKDGSELKTSHSVSAVQMSIALQYGMPPSQIAHTLRGVRSFPGRLRIHEPAELDGERVGSLWDAVARIMEVVIDEEGRHRDFVGACSCESTERPALPATRAVEVVDDGCPDEVVDDAPGGVGPCLVVHGDRACLLLAGHGGPHVDPTTGVGWDLRDRPLCDARLVLGGGGVLTCLLARGHAGTHLDPKTERGWQQDEVEEVPA